MLNYSSPHRVNTDLIVLAPKGDPTLLCRYVELPRSLHTAPLYRLVGSCGVHTAARQLIRVLDVQPAGGCGVDVPRRDPSVVEDGLEVEPVLRPHAQARANERLAVGAQGAPELDLCAADLVVSLKRNIAANHVVEEDAEGPDGEGSGAVAVAADPFGWGIHAGTVKISIFLIFQESSGPKVNELEGERVQVNEQVLVLDVPVDDPLPVASQHGLDHLLEEPPGQGLLQHLGLGDEVEEVLGVPRLLHHVDEGV